MALLEKLSNQNGNQGSSDVCRKLFPLDESSRRQLAGAYIGLIPLPNEAASEVSGRAEHHQVVPLLEPGSGSIAKVSPPCTCTCISPSSEGPKGKCIQEGKRNRRCEVLHRCSSLVAQKVGHGFPKGVADGATEVSRGQKSCEGKGGHPQGQGNGSNRLAMGDGHWTSRLRRPPGNPKGFPV